MSGYHDGTPDLFCLTGPVRYPVGLTPDYYPMPYSYRTPKQFSGNAHQRRVKRRAQARSQHPATRKAAP